jgi:proton-translocating NADH-quinone oxidoreductase chain M
MLDFPILVLLQLLPLVTGIFLPFISNKQLSKKIGFFSSLIVFGLSGMIWVFFDNSLSSFQFIVSYSWISFINVNFFFGIDGISLFFILLTSFLIPLCFIFSWNSLSVGNLSVVNYFSLFLIIESFIIIVFTALDLFVFYIFFEAVLLPIFLIIGLWGSRNRKSRASFLLFIYTVFGSLFILLGVLFVFFETGTTNYLLLLDFNFSVLHQKFLWLAFFLSFSVKVPIIPIHLWLPEAHVEASTEGSVMLAGILLKLGSYGLIRVSIALFPIASLYFRPFLFLISTLAVIYTSMTSLRQSDIKRVIAYASIAHMNITLLGLFSFSFIGIEGAILQMLSHGLVSGALFFCVGVLYNRHHTKLIYYYSGLVQTIPLFVFSFLLFTIANIALPGTSSFVGEFIILLGLFSNNVFVAFFSALSMVFGGCYALWLFNRIAYGNLQSLYLSFSSDLIKNEFFVIIHLVFFVLFIGIYPSIFLQSIHSTCNALFILIHTFNLNAFYYY